MENDSLQIPFSCLSFKEVFSQISIVTSCSFTNTDVCQPTQYELTNLFTQLLVRLKNNFRSLACKFSYQKHSDGFLCAVEINC